MSTTPTRTRAGFVEVTLIVFGLYALGIGLFMMFFPGTFFGTLGTFGVRNDHYIFDNATFEIPQGLLLHWALHAISHIVDPHHGAGDLIGWLEAGGLVVTTVILAIALRASANADKAPTTIPR